MTGAAPEDPLDRILDEQIYCGDGYKPFREMTVDEVEARAAELAGAAGVSAMQRIASIASVWKGLGEAMRSEDAATVADLDRETLRKRADRLHVVPPGGSYL